MVKGFSGRDRDFEVENLDQRIKDIALTLPKRKQRQLEDAACHLDDTAFRFSLYLGDVLLFTPRDQYNEIIKMAIEQLSEWLEQERPGDDYKTHPNFKEEDWDTIDNLLDELARAISRIEKKF